MGLILPQLLMNMVKLFLKNCLLLSGNSCVSIKHTKLLMQLGVFLFCLTAQRSAAQRIGNYIANGDFEKYYDCSTPYMIQKAKYWTGIDTSCGGGVWLSICNGKVPKWSAGGVIDSYQYPHSGQAFYGGVFYYTTFTPTEQRTPARNRLKATLKEGKNYCVKFYANVSNGSPYGIDGIGAYFGGNEIDTITYCHVPLSYLTPQVQNLQGNIITDTLNWIPITGTFTANGTEKYLVLSNFLSNEDTDTLMINPTHLPMIYSEFCIDDVSCIPIDLEAYAGRDTTIFIGDSVYIGRENDFAIDTGCVWYKLPSTTAIDTISGMWVKPPIGTHTYVVRQELECSSLKWDTVIVNVKEKIIDTTGVEEFEDESLKLRVYPNPVSSVMSVELGVMNGEVEIKIIDVLGKELKDENLKLKEGKGEIDVSGLENGIYILKITNKQQKTISKKLVIAK
ncbi:MAG: T9SS type A sorting domain-containing protein [Bacteroidetes bacterium]|nr:T9SS type A sorting domain-containing protein [Bacteroidota bacterium]